MVGKPGGGDKRVGEVPFPTPHPKRDPLEKKTKEPKTNEKNRRAGENDTTRPFKRKTEKDEMGTLHEDAVRRNPIGRQPGNWVKEGD